MNFRRKNFTKKLVTKLTTCKRKISSYKPAFSNFDKTHALAYLFNQIIGSLKTSNSLPQLTDKPKLQSNITFPEKKPFKEEELKNLRVEKLELSSSHYTNRERLQVNVRRIMLSAFDNKLVNNAYIYVVVSLLPDKNAFYESELRPIAEENYFEEAHEFDVNDTELDQKSLKVSIYACDRFSQHRLVNEYTYDLSVEHEEIEGERASILHVNMKQTSRSQDNEVLAFLFLFIT